MSLVTFTPFNANFLLFLGLLSSIVFASPAHASDTAEDEFFIDESFVEFRFKKTGNAFYRVMMDEDENPYLSVNDLLSSWFEMSVDCSSERHYCQGIMQPGNKIYWVDAEQNQYGSSEYQEKKDLPKNGLLFKDGEAWLRYDIWDQWFPLNLVWELNRYAINIQPYFLLARDRKKIRKQRQIKIIEEQNKARREATLESLEPTAHTQSELRYSIVGNTDFEEDHASDINIDVGADIYQGRFDLSANASSETRANQDEINYWQYQRLNNKHFHLFEMGDTRYDSSLLSSSINLKDGIKFRKNKNKIGVGIFELQDRTEPNTEIEFYINGFLAGILNSDNDGQFNIDQTPVSSGDRIELRFFFEDGTEEKQVITIARDESSILEKNDFNWHFVSGNADEGQLTSGYLAYGLFDNFTIGSQLLVLPQTNTGSDETVSTLEFGFRPFSNLSFGIEAAPSETGWDYSSRINISAFQSQIIQLEFFKLEEDSFLQRSRLFNYEATEFKRIFHGLRMAPWSINTELMETNSETSLETSIDYRYTRDIDINVSLDNTQQHATDRNMLSSSATLNYHYNYSSTFEFTRTDSDAASGWNLRYRHVGHSASPWNDKEAHAPWRLAIGANISDEGDEVYDLNMVWSNTRNITSNFQANRSGIEYRITWRDSYTYRSLSARSGNQYAIERNSWNTFRQGTIEGYIMSPPEGDNPGEPIEDVIIRASGQRTTTDENGYYRLSGVPVNKRIRIKIDPNTLDASLAPAEEFHFVELRAGTTLILNPVISWTSGFDGQLLTDLDIPSTAKLIIINQETGSTASEVSVESDGFFLAEGLLPGKYKLVLDGVKNPPEPSLLEIPPAVDWISDVKVQW